MQSCSTPCKRNGLIQHCGIELSLVTLHRQMWWIDFFSPVFYLECVSVCMSEREFHFHLNLAWLSEAARCMRGDCSGGRSQAGFCPVLCSCPAPLGPSGAAAPLGEPAPSAARPGHARTCSAGSSMGTHTNNSDFKLNFSLGAAG